MVVPVLPLAPVSPQHFSRLLPEEWRTRPCAVALSGGPDSCALAYLLDGWAKLPVVKLIVDHGLRPESKDEARAVAEAWGAEVLTWQGVKPQAGLMEAARAARYDLLTAACRAKNIDILFVAHHADDNAETVAMRHGHGSGWRGLAGMPARTYYHNVLIVRPLLKFSKAQLVATCEVGGLQYVRDPSNQNPRFERVRWRQVGELPAVDVQLRQRRNLELAGFRQLLANSDITLHPEGWAECRDFKALTPALVRLLLMQVGQSDYPPSEAAVNRLFNRGIGSLAGAYMHSRQIFPEVPDETFSLPAGESRIWARRWSVMSDEPVTVAALADTPWRQHADSKWLSSLPHAVRRAYPAAFQSGRLVGVPGVWGPLRAVFCPRRLPLFDRFL